MPNVNIFEWEGSYAISGTISPALPADKPGQVKVRAVGVDDRITFQAADGDSIDQVDAETTDIIINVPGGAESFLIPLDVENAPGIQGDIAIDLTIVEFTVGGGTVPTAINADSELEVTVIDDEIQAVMSKGDHATDADFDTSVGIPLVLDRAVAEDVVVTITASPANGLDAADFSLPTSVTFTGNNSLTAGAPSQTTQTIPLVISNPTAAGTLNITMAVSQGNATGAVASQINVTGTGATISAQFQSSAPITKSETEEGNLGITVVLSQALPAPGTLSFSVSPAPDVRLVNSDLGATLEDTFTLAVQAGATSIILPVELVDAPGEQGDETFVITLDSFVPNSNLYNGALGVKVTKSITVLDDEVPTTVRLFSPANNGTILEGEQAVVMATLDRAVADDTVVQIAYTAGTAEQGTDFALDNRLTIPAGTTQSTTDNAAVFALDDCRANRTLDIGGAILAGSYASFGTEDATLSFNLSGDGNPVYIQFSGGVFNATEGGPFDLTFSASQTLEEEVAATILFPSERFPGLAADDYEVDVLIPSGVDSYTWTGQIPNTATTNQSGEVTFTLLGVVSTATDPISTPLLGADVTSEVYVTDNDIDAVIQFNQGSYNQTAGDTGIVATLVADRPVASDVVLNLTPGGALASDIINEPASVTMLAGEDSVSFTFDIDATSVGGLATITASIGSGPAVVNTAGGLHRIVVTIDTVPVTNSVITLDNPGTVQDFDEWVGGSFTISGTIDPAFPVSGNVTVSAIPQAMGGGVYESDSRVSFSNGTPTSGVTIPVTGGVSSFSFPVYVSGNDVADVAGALTRLTRVAITDASSTSHAVTFGPADNAHSKFVRVTDDDISTDMSWSIDTTSVFVDDDTGADINVTITLDHAVSGDAEFSFDYSWRETFVGGGLNIPVITVPAHSTTATGILHVSAGTYQDFNLTLSAGTAAGNVLVDLDSTDTATRTVVCPDAPTPPGVALGAPSQVVYRTPNQSYLAVSPGYETGPLSGHITTNIDHLVQAVVPIDPAPLADLPYFTIDGNHADVFPVSYDADDKVRTVQVVAPAAPGYNFTSTPLSLDVTSIDGSAILERVDSPGTATQTISEVDLDLLHLSLFLDDGTQVVEVKTPNLPQWELVEVVRDGAYVQEKHYFAQFSEYPTGYNLPTGYSEKVLGVHAFVTQRSDVDLAEVVFTVANDVFDDTQGDRHHPHPEVNGDVWFYGIKVNTRAGYGMLEGTQWTLQSGAVKIEETDPSIDSANGWLVRPISNANPDALQTGITRGQSILHVMPKQTRFMRKCAVTQLTPENKALAVYLNRFGGYGVAHAIAFDPVTEKPLGHTYQAKRGYGAQQDYMPPIDHVKLYATHGAYDFADWYSLFGSSGREQFRARTSGSLRLMRSGARSQGAGDYEDGGIVNGVGWQVITASYGDLFGNEPDTAKFNSWFRPWQREDLTSGGGHGVTPRVGYNQCPEDIELGFIQTCYVMQRNRLSLTNLQGKVVEPEQIAKVTGDFHNGGTPILPWRVDTWRGHTNKGGNHPHFFGPRTDVNLDPAPFDNGIDYHQTVPLAPTNRFWNEPDVSLPTAYTHLNQKSTATSTEINKMKIMFGDGHFSHYNFFNSTDGEHHFRVINMCQPPVWYGNVGAIKDYLQRDAAFCRNAHSNYDVMGAYQHTDGNSYRQKDHDGYRRLNFLYLATEGKNRINSGVGAQMTNRAVGEPIESIGVSFSILGDQTKRAQIKSEWLPVAVDAMKNTIFPGGIATTSDGIQNEQQYDFGPITWDSTWQEMNYLESGLSGFQDILDLNDAEFELEYNRRQGKGDFPVGGGYMRMCQSVTSHHYFTHGSFGLAVAMEGVDPSNLGPLGESLLTTLGYLPLRQWQWTDRKRQLFSSVLSGLDNTDPEFYRNIRLADQEDYCPQTGIVTGATGNDGNFKPAMDFIPWSWPNSQTNSWYVTGHRPIRDALTQGYAYRMTGDKRFLRWGAQMMFDQYRGCQYDSNWNSVGATLDNAIECSAINSTTASSVVPSSIDNGGRLWALITVQDYHSLFDIDTIEPPTMVDPVGCHMAGWAGECIHQDWDLTYNPTQPPNYDYVKSSAHGQAYFQEANGTGGGVGFPDGIKKSSDVVADWVFSGTTLTDNVSSLTLSDAGTGTLTVGEQGGVNFVNFSNARMDVPATDADQILAALQAAGDEVTFEFWIRPTDTTNEGPARLMSWSHEATPTGRANAQVTMSKWGNQSAYHGHLGAKSWDTGRYAPGDIHELEQGQLNHVVVSIKGIDCSGWVNTYNNTGGTEITQTIQNMNSPWVPASLGRALAGWTSGHRITVGDEKDGQSIDRHIDGDIFRMSIYSAAFTPNDVSANYYAGPDADLGVVTVTQPARGGFTTSLVAEAEDADQKTITIQGSYNKALESATVLTVSADIPAAETRLSAVGFTGNTLDISLAQGESAFSFDLLMTSATGDQGTQISRFYLTSDTGVDSEIDSNASAMAVQLVDGNTGGGTGGTGGGGQGGGGSTGGGTGSTVTEITSVHGITWYFDQPVEAGQFISGDWWVVGPVSVTAIDPAPGSVTEEGEVRYYNGSMVDLPLPSGIAEVTGHERLDSHDLDFTVDVSAMQFDVYTGNRRGRQQGFVSRWNNAGGSAAYNWTYRYDHNLNAAYPNGQVLSDTNPLTLQAGQVLNSSWTEPLCPYDPDATGQTFGVYVDGQHVRDLPMDATPRSHSNQLIRNDGQAAAENVIRAIEALTVVSEVPTGYNSGGTGAGGGGGLPTQYIDAMLPTRIGTWYTSKDKTYNLGGATGNDTETVAIWDELNQIGVGTALRWQNHKNVSPIDPPYSQGEWDSMNESMRFVGTRSIGLSTDDTALPQSYAKAHSNSTTYQPVAGDPLEDGTPVDYRWIGFGIDDWEIPFTAVDANGDSHTADYWMMGHEIELAAGGITPWDIDTATGQPKWTEYDSTKTYTTGDKVFMIDKISAYDDNNSYNTMRGRMQVFRAKQSVPAGEAPNWKLAAGYSDQYLPADTAYWVRDTGDTTVDWGHGVPAFVVKEHAERFKAAYPEKKLYMFFGKGLNVAGWNGNDAITRPDVVDPVFGTFDDQLSWFSAVASIEAIDGYMFDYYPFNSKYTGRQAYKNSDAPDVYVHPITGGTYLVDDAKWVVSGVHRLKDWSVTPDFPEGKPVYVTLTSSPNYVSGINDVSPDPTAGGLSEWFHFTTPTTQQHIDLVTSCVDAGADGFIWYNHCWKWTSNDAGTAMVQKGAAGPGSDFWPFAWKNRWTNKAINGGVPITDANGNETNLHGKYFPNIPNVDLSGDGSWEMMIAVNQHILSLLPEVDRNGQGAIVPPLVDSPPPTNAEGWFRPSPMAMNGAENQQYKEVQYHTSTVDDWLATGVLANLPTNLQAGQHVFDYDTFMTPTPLGMWNKIPGVGDQVPVSNPEDYYYLHPDGTQQPYWYPGGKNRVTATNQAVCDNVYTINQTFNSDRQQYTYGASLQPYNDGVMLALNQDIPLEHKRDLLIHYLQYGIDLDAMYRSGMRWPPNGDHNNGRYTPILLKRIVFGEDLSDLHPQLFSENRQAYLIPDTLAEANFYVCQGPENPAADQTTSGSCWRYQVGFNTSLYDPTDGLLEGATSQDIEGMPFSEEQLGEAMWCQWGWPPYRGDSHHPLTSDIKNPKYLEQTGRTGYGQAIGWRAMNLMDEYGAPQFFDLVDKKALLVGPRQPYADVVTGVPKRGIGLPFTGYDSAGNGRTANGLLYDLYRGLVGPDYSVSSANFNSGLNNGKDHNANTNRGSYTPNPGYTSLSAILDGPFPGSTPPPGTGGGTGSDDLGDVGNNPFYAGVGQEGRGEPYLYPPAIDDSATNTNGVINGANTGHRTYLSSMTVSAIPATGDKCYTFVKQGECGSYTDCIEVPPAGLMVSGVVFSAVDSYQHNRMIQIANNMDYDLSFVDCLFIGQTHFFQRYSDNGGTVHPTKLNQSTGNKGLAYHVIVKDLGQSNNVTGVDFQWCSFRGVQSKIISVPLRKFYRNNLDWFTADAINMMTNGTWGGGASAPKIHYEECWWGDSSHVRGLPSCNPTSRPTLFDCTETTTYGGYDVENCKPLYYTQCGMFAYNWTWPAGDEVHSDSFQMVSSEIEEFRATRCTFAAMPTLWLPGSGDWNSRWLHNSSAKYSPKWHEVPEQLSSMTVDGYPAPPPTSFGTIYERMHDKHMQTDGEYARMKDIIFDRCSIMGAGANHHAVKNPKFQLKTVNGSKRWIIWGCPDDATPLYPGGGNDPAGSPGYEQYDSTYYNVGKCNVGNSYSKLWNEYDNGQPTRWHYLDCNWGMAVQSGMAIINSSQNLGIPHDVLLDLEPNPISNLHSTAVLSSCDELRAAGYTDAAWPSMVNCLDKFDSKEFVTDGNNKFIDVETGATCKTIRMNDGTDIYGTVNPVMECEDFVNGRPVVGNNTSIINRLHRELPQYENDFTFYHTTFYHPDKTSPVTGTNRFPLYNLKPFTSRDRCQCED